MQAEALNLGVASDKLHSRATTGTKPGIGSAFLIRDSMQENTGFTRSGNDVDALNGDAREDGVTGNHMRGAGHGYEELGLNQGLTPRVYSCLSGV